jgi:RecA-superfamily ATPases implicated in signal transduction
VSTTTARAWLAQSTDRNSVVRKLQVIKSRGRAPMPGLHTFRITDDGLQVFPRIPEQIGNRVLQKRERMSTGVPGMDEMIGGGVIAGDAVMLTGPAGSGKSTVATQFMVAGLANGESGVIAVFEEYPEEYRARANKRNPSVGKSIKAGKLELIYLRPLDLSVDEALLVYLDPPFGSARNYNVLFEEQDGSRAAAQNKPSRIRGSGMPRHLLLSTML